MEPRQVVKVDDLEISLTLDEFLLRDLQTLAARINGSVHRNLRLAGTDRLRVRPQSLAAPTHQQSPTPNSSDSAQPDASMATRSRIKAPLLLPVAKILFTLVSKSKLENDSLPSGRRVPWLFVKDPRSTLTPSFFCTII